ncbi:MAG: c-type cytochrome [Terriglobia bacterium]
MNLSAAQSRPASRSARPHPRLSHGTIPSRASFVSRCAVCHGLDGRGGEHAPDIATNPRVQQLSDVRLFEIIRDGIPAGGMPSFSALGKPGIQAVLGYLRILQGSHRAQPVPGNAARGRALFFGSAGCSGCHMIRGQGGFLGPDLSDYAISHSLPEIRGAILEPNKNLSSQRGTVTVVTRDGRKYTGVARNEDNFSLQMQTPDGAFHLFMKSDLTAVRYESRSLMPSDYGSKLSAGQLDDVVSFLVRATEAHNGQEDLNAK